MAENHALHLGKLLGNLQSIEVALRFYLMPSGVAVHESEPPPPNLWVLNVGDVLTVDAFTNYDTLGALVKRYNTIITRTRSDLAVSPKVVELRDLLVHGRVMGKFADANHLWIMKFSKITKENTVTVTHYALMDERWFADCKALTSAALENIAQAFDHRGLNHD